MQDFRQTTKLAKLPKSPPANIKSGGGGVNGERCTGAGFPTTTVLPRMCFFVGGPPEQVPQTTQTMLGNRMGWLFASLPTVSAPSKQYKSKRG